MSNQRRNIVDAIDALRFDAIADLADLAASYWLSIGEAAKRGEKLTCEVHCRQVAAVTRAAFRTVKTLGEAVEEGQAA
jgi:hypothetical protein